jgi:FkbM family methyltransferase
MKYVENKYSFPLDFDWGDLAGQPAEFVTWEICEKQVYDRWNCVKPGDIVVDVGSSVGPFTYTAALNGAKKVYLLEPSNNLIKTSIKNLSNLMINGDDKFAFVNYAISDQDRFDVVKTDSNSNVFGNNETFNTMKFSTFIDKYKIDHIDFLKIDCEGGEYDIFIEENMDFLKNKVKFISAEIHFRTIKASPDKFFDLRDKYLSQFSNIKVTTGDEKIWNYYLYDNNTMLQILNETELMIYIQNN